MIFVVERGTSKVDQVDVWLKKNPPKLGRPRVQRARGWNVAIVSESLVSVANQQDVLWLQIGVNEVEVV